MIRCRGMAFRDEDDAYDYFRQRELDESDQSIPEVLLQPDAGELAGAAPRVPGKTPEAR